MFSRSICCSVFLLFFIATTTVEAGPLLDWLRNKCKRNNGNIEVGGLQATAGSFTQAPTTLMPGQCQRTCMQTCQRTVVNYVPYTAYRTDWQRVPVTQYKPVTNSDPVSGCTVTCMRPCTDYSWQLQRTPYTTYRPVYQTQNYNVPVTTISNDCANGGCSTCGVPAAGSFPQMAPGTGGFIPANSGVAADTIPTVNSNRPAYGIYDGYPTPENYQAYPIPGTVIPGNVVGSQNLGVYNQLPSNSTSPQAYSGMTQYSGYGAGMSAAQSNIYTQPTPSSYEAPQPGFSGQVYGGGSLPADKTPILSDPGAANGANLQNSQGTTVPGSGVPGSGVPGSGVPGSSVPIPGVQSVLSNSREAQPLTDPSPDMRWDFNVPQLGRPEDQSAHRDVQVRWAYTLTNGATHSDAIPASINSNRSSQQRQVNSEWDHSETENSFDHSTVNSDWN